MPVSQAEVMILWSGMSRLGNWSVAEPSHSRRNRGILRYLVAPAGYLCTFFPLQLSSYVCRMCLDV